MSSPPESKSSGMKFAERQLKRHGWKQGKGLGRKESGISEAIKVKVKCGTAGVGHNSAEQFTFHWWDHIFNKTASNIAVETDKDGIQMKRRTEEGGQISNKKPRKGLNCHTMLYGRFIKAAILMSGGEMPVEEPKLSESSEDDEEKLDLSSANRLTDEELMRACGGRTAHKGARHGLRMSAKLSRLEEQEQAFLSTYEEKKQKEESSHEQQEPENKSHKKKKRKKSKRSEDRAVESSEEQRSGAAAKKRKKTEGHDEGHSKAACSTEEQEEATEGGGEEKKKQRRERKRDNSRKKKKKKKNKTKEEK